MGEAVGERLELNGAACDANRELLVKKLGRN